MASGGKGERGEYQSEKDEDDRVDDVYGVGIAGHCAGNRSLTVDSVLCPFERFLIFYIPGQGKEDADTKRLFTWTTVYPIHAPAARITRIRAMIPSVFLFMDITSVP